MQSKWEKIEFSVDLVELARIYLSFLESVQSDENVFNDEIVKRALYRYEKFWLPFYYSLDKVGEDVKNIYPPNDIAWIWNCHILSPVDYQNDCVREYGQSIEHYCFSGEEILKKQAYTKQLWETNFQISFDYADEYSIGVDKTDYNSFQSKFDINLLEASQKHRDFYYQVSCRHFKDLDFLNLCVNRYKKFLYLKSLHENEPINACNGILIIWLSHVRSNVSYVNDTFKIFNHLLAFDYRNDYAPKTWLELDKLDMKTFDLWMATFDEEFYFPGAMYRGEKPSKYDYSQNESLDLKLFFTHKGKFTLIQSCLNRKGTSSLEDVNPRFEFKVYRYKYQIYDGIQDVNQPLTFKRSFDFNELYESSLDIKVAVSYVETLPRPKFPFRLEQKSTFKNHTTFKLHISVPIKAYELQDFSLDLEDVYGNEYELNQKWSIESHLQNSIGLFLHKKPFESINLNDVLGEYTAFDYLKEKYFNNDLKEQNAVRAQHTISAHLSHHKTDLYQLEILHVVGLKWTSLKIMRGSRLMATSHLIGTAHLPSNSNVKADNLYVLTYDNKTERAMLVRNMNGDYAILKGKWVKMKSARALKGKDLVGMAPEPGHLKIYLYSFEKKFAQEINIFSHLLFEITNGNVRSNVDLNWGKVEMQFLSDNVSSLEVESNLAIIYTIATLHVMLQPKPRPYMMRKYGDIQVNPILLKKKSYVNDMMKPIHLKSNYLLDSVGYLNLVKTDAYKRNYSNFFDADFHHFHNLKYHNGHETFMYDHNYWFNDVNNFIKILDMDNYEFNHD